MSNQAAERAEHQITKGDSHHGAHTNNLQQEAQALLGGMANNVKHASKDVQHLDFSDPFKIAGDAVKQAGAAAAHTAEAAGSAIAKGADQAWHDADKNKVTSFIKNDLAHGDPVKAAVYGTAALGAGAIGLALGAPLAIEAAGVSAFATGMMGTGLVLNGAATYAMDHLGKK